MPLVWPGEETLDHLICKCSKLKWYQISILSLLDLRTDDFNFLSSGNWLIFKNHTRSNDAWAKALISSMALIVWKECYNYIFKKTIPRFDNIIARAGNLCSDLFRASGKIYKESSSSCTLPHSLHTISVFLDISCHSRTWYTGLGFLIISNSGLIFLIGSLGAVHSSPVSAEIDVVIHVLDVYRERNQNPIRICCDCPGITRLLEHHHPCNYWHFNPEIQKLRHLPHFFQHTSIVTIPREDNNIAD